MNTLSELIAAGVVVCVNEVHHNMYDDSYFCDILFNLKDRTVTEFTTHTTAAGGFTCSDSVSIKSFSTELRTEIMDMFKQVSAEIAERYYKENNIIHIGDTLIVSNKRARNFKGVTFTCTDKSVYRDNYGRVQTHYVHGEDLKTNETNCTVLTVNNSVLNNAWQDLYHGIKLS